MKHFLTGMMVLALMPLGMAHAQKAIPDAPPSAVQPPATTETEAPVEAPVAASAVPSDMVLSFGKSPYSLFFTPAQIDTMKQTLTVYETTPADQKAEQAIVAVEAVEPPAPATYPVYTLGSIAYRNGSDWTVWLNGVRITPRTNEQVVKVVAVSADLAQFEWKPSYLAAFTQRQQKEKFADTARVKHKLVQPNRSSFDMKSGTVTFTLRPNQSFAAGYMAVFEGHIASPALEPIVDPAEAAAAAAAAATLADGEAVSDDSLGSAPVGSNNPQEQLKEESKGVGGDAIKRMYEKAAGYDEKPVDDTKKNMQTIDELLKNQQTLSVSPRP